MHSQPVRALPYLLALPGSYFGTTRYNLVQQSCWQLLKQECKEHSVSRLEHVAALCMLYCVQVGAALDSEREPSQRMQPGEPYDPVSPIDAAEEVSSSCLAPCGSWTCLTQQCTVPRKAQLGSAELWCCSTTTAGMIATCQSYGLPDPLTVLLGCGGLITQCALNARHSPKCCVRLGYCLLAACHTCEAPSRLDRHYQAGWLCSNCDHRVKPHVGGMARQ